MANPGNGNNGGGGGGGTGGGGSNAGPFTAGRTKYVRTDATTEYFLWINSHWIIYNPITNYFYVTDPSSNHVVVLNAATETEVAVMTVPGAYSVDDTPDHKTLYVGTLIGDVYKLDPVGLTVTARYPSAQIGPNGYFAMSAVVMADGQLGLLGQAGGIPSVDGSTSFAVWNSASNAITVYPSASTPLPCGNFLNIGGFSRTADRSRIIIYGVDGGPLCEIDEATGQGIVSSASGLPGVNFRVTPDGKYIIVPSNTLAAPPNNTYAYVYDASTLSLVKQILVSGDTSTGSGFAISADSKTLFVPTDSIIYAYDIASGNQVGWLPNTYVPALAGGYVVGPLNGPNLQAADGTGLLVGPLEEGVAFIDTTTMRTGAVGTPFTNGYLSPATGPTSGGTQVTIKEPILSALSAIYFGSEGAPDESGGSGSVSANSPAGKAGPSDVYVFTSDGGIQVLPEGFSYGPTIVETTPNMASEDGSGTGVVYGYGFGPLGTGTSIPSSLQVSVGGKPAQITSFAPYAYPVQSPPFPLQAFSYVIPPGTTAADVTVTSSSGSSTAHSALAYLPAVQQFPVPAALAQGVYDPHTDLYYFTDSTQIRVFSRTEGAWLTPISIPLPPSAVQRLWGIAVSPDGSKMAVGDALGQAIYVLDPTAPTSVQIFSVPTIPNAGTGFITNAVGVAISDAGIVYYAATVQGGTGFDQFFKLDTTTGVVTPYLLTPGPGTPAADIYLRVQLSPDNSTVFFNGDGAVFKVDTATDTITYATVDPGCCYGDYELTLSGDGTRLCATGYFYDSNLAAESSYALNDREAMNIEYIYGAKLSADGNLLFQPSTIGMDVFDGRLGTLLTRISLAASLSATYDALVTDGQDNVLVAITGAGDGIAVVDLTSIKEPSALPYVAKLSAGGWPELHPDSTLGPHTSRVPSTRTNKVRHVTKSAPRRSATGMPRRLAK